jgi:hypothetical protein
LNSILVKPAVWSLDSHDQLVKNFQGFCESKELVLSPDFLSVANDLKTRISDHRDYQIQHEKSPRTLYATSFDRDGKTTIKQVRLNPTDKDREIESAPVGDLLAAAEQYLKLAIEMIRSNVDKSVVKRHTAVSSPRQGDDGEVLQQHAGDHAEMF